jgi:hypothetical protein
MPVFRSRCATIQISDSIVLLAMCRMSGHAFLPASLPGVTIKALQHPAKARALYCHCVTAHVQDWCRKLCTKVASAPEPSSRGVRANMLRQVHLQQRLCQASDAPARSQVHFPHLLQHPTVSATRTSMHSATLNHALATMGGLNLEAADRGLACVESGQNSMKIASTCQVTSRPLTWGTP